MKRNTVLKWVKVANHLEIFVKKNFVTDVFHGILENFPEELSSKMTLSDFFPTRKRNLSFHELFLYLHKTIFQLLHKECCLL